MISTRHGGLNLKALAALSFAYAFTPIGKPGPEQPEYPPRTSDKASSRIVCKEPARATFTSEKPLTKRQKRRLRGKGKS